MTLLADQRLVVWVTLSLPRRYQDPNNAVIWGATRYRNAVVVDWHRFSAGRDELFWDDRIHLQPEAAQAYASLIAAAISRKAS